MAVGSLSQWLANLNAEVQRTNVDYPQNLVPGWPIPLFGDVRRARVLTVGVNPSDKEFDEHRHWNLVNGPFQWEKRILNYFHISGVPPRPWFETWSICLELIGLSYAGRSAGHIDVSPRPTRPMLDETIDANEFRAMAEHDVKWFFELLSQLPQVRLLLVAGPIPRASGKKQQLADFIRVQSTKYCCRWETSPPLPKLFTPAHAEGIPVCICPFEPEVDGCYAMIRHVYRNRELLKRCI